jgi:bacillithiol biosynthesis cysteine-adding enzyme BshC
VLPQSGISASALSGAGVRGGDTTGIVRLPIDIRRFPWIKRLAADYAYDYARLAEFFAGDPSSPDAWRDAIGRTQRHARDRRAIAEILQAQQRRRHAPADAIAAAAQLSEPDTVAIVTGQQAGLFGGPLFTLLKALTAVRLAERVREEHGVPAVALFWIDAEDHDWDEVRSCGLLGPDLDVRSVSVGAPPGANEGPVARVRLDESVVAATADLEATLQPTEFSPQVLETLRATYGPGAGMADAFGRWLESLLGARGLIVFDASDPAAKPLVAGVFAREIEHAGETSRLAAAAGAALEARGYHAQATPPADSVSLFHLNEHRAPVRRAGDGFQVGDQAFARAALLDEARQHPERFSPNVLLRPLIQDSLFPTACYVAGPSELAYLAQLGRVYDAFGIPMPLIQSRATATIVDSNAMRFLTRHEFPFESLRAQDEAALNALLESQLPPRIEALLQDTSSAVEDRLGQLAVAITELDATLEGATRSTLGRVQDDLKKLHGKVIQAAKRKNETLRRQYHHVQAQAFPGGHPQERQVGCIYFLNKYGPALVDRLSGELSLDMGTHWVVTI